VRLGKLRSRAIPFLTMDDYLFRHHVNECRPVSEATSYLEIFNYSVSGGQEKLEFSIRCRPPDNKGKES
jgi:hypothetical protein